MNSSPQKERSALRQEDAPSSKQEQGQPTDPCENFNQYPQGAEAAISRYRHAFQKIPDSQTTISEFIREIRSEEHRTTVERVRATLASCNGQDKEAKAKAKLQVDTIKKELPAVSLSGLLTGGERKNAPDEGRFKHSGWLQADFDEGGLNGRDPAAVRDALVSDPHVQASFITPSGEGCKAIVRVPVCRSVSEHKAAFNAAEVHFFERYGLKIDQQTKDPGRLCFASYDPEACWNEGPVIPLPIPPPAEAKPPRTQPEPTSQKSPPTGNYPAMDIFELPEILRYIPSRPDYDEWLKVASGAWNEFGQAATPHLLEWSPEEHTGEYTDKFQCRLKTVGIGSLIMLAKEGGYKPRPGTQAYTMSESIRVIMAERAFDAATVPPKPTPILKLGGKVISTPGNLTNIQAPAKAGKTAVIGAIIASMFNGNRVGADTLGFSASNLQEKAVIHFDTEQSRFDHDMLIRRAMIRAQVEKPPTWFYSYCLTDVSIPNRKQAIQAAMEDAVSYHGGVFVVIIDGVADICVSPNDETESFRLVGDLHGDAVKYDCAIITVLHENPNSETGKMRGHLGSQLERKAETPIRLAKDATSGITTIWSDRCRHNHIPKTQGTCFAWSDVAGMHVSMGRAAEIKSDAARVRMVEEATGVFRGRDAMRYSDLVVAIKDALHLKDRAAKNRIKTWMKAGLIKNSAGLYHLPIA